VDASLACGALRFGSFTLKSGRLSPYFFNAGSLASGSSLRVLGEAYAHAIARAGVPFDVAFGPAYKGIPLVTAAAAALAALPPPAGADVPIAYNRKEAKDHGEGGALVGAPLAGRRVLIVDDVITAGTAVGEAVDVIAAAGGAAVGVVVGLDRQEVAGGGGALSAVQQVTAAYAIPVVAVITLDDLVAYIQEALAAGRALVGLEGMTGDELLDRVRAYRATYGPKTK
jgi:orotate phosphoribosyltransferase